MKLSTKSRYALEGMLYIAVYGKDKLLSIKEIAAGTTVSPAYMEQIFFTLKKAGLVSTVRGAKGGFALGCPENEITVGTILRAIDGNLVPVPCAASLSACKSKVRSNCVSRNVWIRISQAISDTADKQTLEMLKNQFIQEGEGAENENIH
ncbi:RrF2 family transcriptional regulator [Caproiciproducens galactitolivorans]|uniref:Rrf2 family transcriptional regulator n=1 Tax=Caproiciproducens galactitolivorans TaxID=642589 RepID=A0ABT4BPG9_9FIRM|nr:Rrf2 family transcriptional regulator [Caproiciproducens galactitolivorans]MCY1712777.1 Rrf2 family transcriptional regulator [Caproiciproducens galactitolivorans]